MAKLEIKVDDLFGGVSIPLVWLERNIGNEDEMVHLAQTIMSVKHKLRSLHFLLKALRGGEHIQSWAFSNFLWQDLEEDSGRRG